MLKWVLSGKAQKVRNKLDEHLENKAGMFKIRGNENKDACTMLCEYVDAMLAGRGDGPSKDALKQMKKSYKRITKSRKESSKCLTFHQGL
jgi:hypothetical protein